MAKLTGDMARAAKESGAIKPGEYLASLTEVSTKFSRTSGNEQWVWHYEILDDEVHEGRQVFDHATLTDAAAWKLSQIFNGFGAPVSTDTDELLGMTVYVTIENEEYDGRLLNRVTKYRRHERENVNSTPN